MLRGLLDVLFPRRCAGCGDGPWPFCPACREALVALSPPGCRRCGRPAEEELERCRDCPPPPIAAARAPFAYEGPARAALHRLKFSGWRGVARALAAPMVAVNAFQPDVVTWVPLSPERRSARGFDQAEVLAREVAALLGVPAIRLLRRTRDTPPQARRRGPERRAAMRGAFRGIGAGRPPPRVLLVDDVLTTGATAAACAAELRAVGAREVALLTAARALGDPLPARSYGPFRAGRAAGHGPPAAGSILGHGLSPESVVARERLSR